MYKIARDERLKVNAREKQISPGFRTNPSGSVRESTCAGFTSRWSTSEAFRSPCPTHCRFRPRDDILAASPEGNAMQNYASFQFGRDLQNEIATNPETNSLGSNPQNETLNKFGVGARSRITVPFRYSNIFTVQFQQSKNVEHSEPIRSGLT